MLICGVDEVGRGPIAGDTTAAAVILPARYDLSGLTDSKALSAKKREALYPLICEQAVAWHVASATVEEIDRMGIAPAVFLAMRRAVEGLSVRPGRILADGNLEPDFGDIPVKAIIRGDLTEPCISAASVLAKVSRDRYMEKMGALYPGYGFAKTRATAQRPMPRGSKGWAGARYTEGLLSFGGCDKTPGVLRRPLCQRGQGREII